MTIIFRLQKKFIEPFSDAFVGYMVITISDKVFEKAFGDGIDAMYRLVRWLLIEWESMVLSMETGIKIKVRYYQYLFNDLNDNPEYLFSVYENQTTGWELVNIIHKSELEKDSTIIGKIIFISVMMLTILSTYISSHHIKSN
jgi:hypothetical protein